MTTTSLNASAFSTKTIFSFILSLTAICCTVNPKKFTVIIASSPETVKLKLPFKSVVVPALVPFSIIVAPGSGPTLSFTVPVITLFCAIAIPPKNSVKHNVKIKFLFIF